ncbi:MAG: PTS sugar transporter subunit IIA [Erysipelotrichia bacterium]|jgi:transcriptional antiterminator|nr:PTS sugar transporter subunit IIA [Erysipelotrichia bacterium]
MLTQRQSDILNYLWHQHQPSRVDDLARIFKVSNKTMRMEIQTITSLASSLKCHVIKKPSVGIMLQDKHSDGWQQLIHSISYVDQNTRQHILFLKALTQSKVSVQQCAQSLQVSRQTLTRDLKQLKSTYGLLEEEFTQTTHGFKLSCSETLLRDRLTKSWAMNIPIHVSTEFLKHSFPEVMKQMSSWLMEFQTMHDFEFETNSQQLLLNTMVILSKRSSLSSIESNTPLSLLETNKPPDLDHDAIARLEQLMTSSRLSKGTLESRKDHEDLAHELLSELCHSLNIQCDENDPQIQSLFMHLKATCQRLKHQSWIENPMLEDVRVSFSLIYDLAQQCLMNFETKHHLSFNDHEISYIVMHLGVLMQSTGLVDAHLKVAIVCPHGSATSRLLLNRIQNILPHHQLYGPYSISEFNTMKSTTPFDVIITTVSLGLEGEIVVNPILSLSDQDRIEKLIWNETYQKQCERILHTYRVNQQEHLSLSMMIQPHHIQLIKQPLSWRQAIHKAAEPLLEEGRIKPSYIEKMIWAVDHLGPYMVILPYIAFVHAAPDDGVIKNGISCLRLKDTISFGDKKSVDVKVIFVIASKAKEDMGLVKLIRLCEHNQNMHTLLHSNSIQDILSMKG